MEQPPHPTRRVEQSRAEQSRAEQSRGGPYGPNPAKRGSLLNPQYTDSSIELFYLWLLK